MAAERAGRDSAPWERRFLLTGLVWALVLLGMWLWGREVTGFDSADPGASARPPAAESRIGERIVDGRPLPYAHDPVADATRPERVVVDALGVHAPVVPGGAGSPAVQAPRPPSEADQVSWWRGGTRPGGRGVAMLTGGVDTEQGRAAFFPLGRARPGMTVEVAGADGVIAEFMVESTDVVRRARFDARRYRTAADERGRAELLLVAPGGGYDRQSHEYTSYVLVSAYLTGTRQT